MIIEKFQFPLSPWTFDYEDICGASFIELTISKKKWCVLLVYRPSKQNKTLFCEEI